MYIISEDNKKANSPLTKIFNFNELKFKERDELSDAIKAWNSKIPYDMEKHRDMRCRGLFKERYDFRKNLMDWDFNMRIKDIAPIIHWIHYRDWRMNGVAHEERFASYIIGNRTLSSYLPGKKRATNESCLVRGYWADIV